MGTVRVETSGSIAIVRIDKARGNSIDEALVEDLLAASQRLSEDDGIAGVLLASAHPKLFCPGLDLQTLSGFDRPTLRRFMERFDQMLRSLYGLRKPVVAAISGHAVAGGCILALTADCRVLRRGGVQIGLNEVKIGVPLPWPVSVLLRATVPSVALSRIALLGRNFADDDALAVGLADELADADGFEATCLARLAEFAEKDPTAVGTTKDYLRRGVLDEMESAAAQSADDFLDAWFSPPTRKRIDEIVASLKR